MKKFFTAGFLSIIIIVVFNNSIFAQNAIADRKLAISGLADQAGNLSVDLSGDPGEVITSSTVVTNLGNENLKVRSEFQDFLVEEETGAPVLVEPESSIWAMSLWMSAPAGTQEFTLEPNESREIIFTINIPRNASPGGHYAMILFTPVIVKEPVAGPLVEHKIGNIVKLTVSGNIRESAEISEFYAPIFSEYGPVNLRLKILNNGNTHVTSSGTIIIKNMAGREVGKWELQPANIFPSAIRTFKTEWPGKWRFGRYTAEAIVEYGSQNTQITSTVSFWIIPWKILAAVVLLILVLIIWGRIINRRRRAEKKPTAAPSTPEINSINSQNEESIPPV